MSIAPFHVLVLALDPRDEQVLRTAVEIHDQLEAAGLDVLLDDRDERAGFKFKDADLIGIPLRVIVGKKSLNEGVVEFSHRKDDVKQRLAPTTVVEHVRRLYTQEMEELMRAPLLPAANGD
jgi:prolyl-tRNA synthetase